MKLENQDNSSEKHIIISVRVPYRSGVHLTKCKLVGFGHLSRKNYRKLYSHG